MLKINFSKWISLVICACVSFITASQSVSDNRNQLPEIGVVASDVLTIDREVQIGKIVMKQLRGQAPLIHDPVLDEYIQDLGNRLVSQADNAKFPFKFFIINNPVINAFAFYGGHIGIHSGLLTTADTESELASVLGHEVAHVTQRHLARAAQAQQRSAPLQIASLIGGILLAMADPNAGMAAVSLGQASSAQSSINYTRNMEQEADNIGINILARAGFDPKGAPAFFGKLASQSRSQLANETAFLRTHPLPESRISETRARAAAYRDITLPTSLAFQLAKARIKARYESNPESNLALFRQQYRSTDDVIQKAAIYGLAISYFELEEYDRAEQTLRPLLTNDPNNLFYLDVMTDIYIKQGQAQKAVNLLTPKWTLKPQNKVLALNLANALIYDQQQERAISILRDILLVDNEHFLSYSLLIDAYAQTQQKKEMHQASAERFALILAYPLAINELQFAYNQVEGDYLEKQRIKARIEQLRLAQANLSKS